MRRPGRGAMRARGVGSVAAVCAVLATVPGVAVADHASRQSLPAPAGPPVMTLVSLTPTRVAQNRTARLRFALDRTATITAAITQVRRGVTVGGRCFAPTPQRRGATCRRTVQLASKRIFGHIGANAATLVVRGLNPGVYRITLTAREGLAVPSNPTVVLFTVTTAPKRG